MNSPDETNEPAGQRISIMVGQAVRMAGLSLLAHPLRTVLTLGGFVVSMVIAVVLIAAGAAVSRAVESILRGLGEGQVIVEPGRTTGMGGVRRSGRPVRIRYQDVVGLSGALPSFEGVAAFYDLRGGGASSRKYSIPWSPVRAVARDYQRVRRIPIAEGRWFNQAESDEGEWVAVLNEGLRRIIFRDEPAVGQWIEWRGRRMEVVGIVRDEALFPYLVFIPYKTVSHMADSRYVSGLIARPLPDADWERAIAELRRVLAGLGGFDPTDSNAVEITSNREFTVRTRIMSSALHALVLTIATVGLLLGGLGVANMMVISVTERTREIGVRQAVGAAPRIIFLETFLEALFVVALGGVAGLVLGAAVCHVIGELPLSETYRAGVRFDGMSAAVSVTVLGLVGLGSALLPARRALRLTPVEALRWE